VLLDVKTGSAGLNPTPPVLPQFNAYVEYWGLAYTERCYAQKMNHKMDYIFPLRPSSFFE